jgi:signal peptidase I
MKKLWNKLSPQFREQFLDFVQSLAIMIGICIFVLVFLVYPSEVEGTSMLPNYQTGNRLYTNKLSHWIGSTQIGKTLSLDYKRGDVVVVDKPGVVSLIKRIIGMPGETLKLQGGNVYINGNMIKEDYLAADTYTGGGTFLKEGEDVQIPEGQYFVMGDNRRVSSDSRYIGLIEENWLQGKIFFRIWPLNEFGAIGTGKYEVTNEKL